MGIYVWTVVDVTTLIPNLHWDIMSRSAKTKLASKKTSTKKASKSSAALKSSKSKKASKKTSAASRVSKKASKKTSAASRVSKKASAKKARVKKSGAKMSGAKANQTKIMKTSKTMAKATTINWDPLEVGKTKGSLCGRWSEPSTGWTGIPSKHSRSRLHMYASSDL